MSINVSVVEYLNTKRRQNYHQKQIALMRKLLIFGTGVNGDESADNMVHNCVGYTKNRLFVSNIVFLSNHLRRLLC